MATATDVDVGRDGGCAELSKALQATKVDLLVCNAGVLREDNVGSLDKLDSLREQFEVNSLGPLRTFKALESNLQPGSKVRAS